MIFSVSSVTYLFLLHPVLIKNRFPAFALIRIKAHPDLLRCTLIIGRFNIIDYNISSADKIHNLLPQCYGMLFQIILPGITIIIIQLIAAILISDQLQRIHINIRNTFRNIRKRNTFIFPNK